MILEFMLKKFHHALIVHCGGTVALAKGGGFTALPTSLLKSFGLSW